MKNDGFACHELPLACPLCGTALELKTMFGDRFGYEILECPQCGYKDGSEPKQAQSPADEAVEFLKSHKEVCNESLWIATVGLKGQFQGFAELPVRKYFNVLDVSKWIRGRLHLNTSGIYALHFINPAYPADFDFRLFQLMKLILFLHGKKFHDYTLIAEKERYSFYENGHFENDESLSTESIRTSA